MSQEDKIYELRQHQQKSGVDNFNPQSLNFYKLLQNSPCVRSPTTQINA